MTFLSLYLFLLLCVSLQIVVEFIKSKPQYCIVLSSSFYKSTQINWIALNFSKGKAIRTYFMFEFYIARNSGILGE